LSRVEIVLFAIGAGLFAFLIRRIGLASVAEAIRNLGPALPLIVGVEALAVLANTLSWRCTITPDRRGDVPFSRLVAGRIVGDAVSYVIPAGAGEIPKTRLLARYLPMKSALASVAMAKLSEAVALGLFGILGLVVAWPILRTSAVSGVTVAIATVVGMGLVVGGVVAARLGLPGPLRQGLIGSTAWHLVGWLVNAVELWLACHFLDLRPSLRVVFAGEALGVLFDALFFFVPMRIGAAEGGRVLVFRLLGFSAAAGLTLGLVRRIRELAWAAAGLAIYPWLASGDRSAPGRGAGRGRHGRAVTA
jgi:hypothetical protein